MHTFLDKLRSDLSSTQSFIALFNFNTRSFLGSFLKYRTAHQGKHCLMAKNTFNLGFHLTIRICTTKYLNYVYCKQNNKSLKPWLSCMGGGKEGTLPEAVGTLPEAVGTILEAVWLPYSETCLPLKFGPKTVEKLA